MEDLVAYFDGEYLPKSKIFLGVDNLGFTRGYGAYECFRTYGRKPFRVQDHILRLKKTCDQLLIEFPKEDLYKITESLIDKNPGSELIFRVYVNDNPENDSYHLTFLCSSPESFSKSHPYDRPLLLKTVIDTRNNTDIKSTSYSTAMVEIKKAKRLGFDDILFTDEQGNINELSRANFFAVKGNTLFTPKSNFLPGITRLTILDIANQFGFRSEERDITLAFLEDMEEVFATSTIRAITPIGEIDHLEFNRYEKTALLKTYFMNLVPAAGNHDKMHLSSSHS
jgi:branched-chain amino acid aminotransferase